MKDLTFSSGQASKPYSKMGIHLVLLFINCKVISSEAHGTPHGRSHIHRASENTRSVLSAQRISAQAQPMCELAILNTS